MILKYGKIGATPCSHSFIYSYQTLRHHKKGKHVTTRISYLSSSIGLVVECSIPGRVIPKTFKMVLDTSLLNIQQYKVRIKGKVERSRERSSAPLHLCVVAIKKGAFWSPSITVANSLYIHDYKLKCITRPDVCDPQ